MESNQTRFVQALTECQEAIRGYCYAKLSNWSDVEEAVQATNVKLWEKQSDWDRERPFLPWALGVARYIILSQVRDQQRERLVFDEDVMTMMERHLVSAAETTSERVHALRNCLAKVEDEPREILKAYYAEGYSIAELEKSMNRSASGIKSMLFRLRKILADCINSELRA